MSKFPFVTRIKLIHSKLSNFFAHVSGSPLAAMSRHAPRDPVTDPG